MEAIESEAKFFGEEKEVSDPVDGEILRIRNSLIDFIVHRQTEMKEILPKVEKLAIQLNLDMKNLTASSEDSPKSSTEVKEQCLFFYRMMHQVNLVYHKNIMDLKETLLSKFIALLGVLIHHLSVAIQVAMGDVGFNGRLLEVYNLIVGRHVDFWYEFDKMNEF